MPRNLSFNQMGLFEQTVRNSHLIHVMVDGELEPLPALRREPVVVHLGVQQDAQPVLLAKLDSGPESGFRVSHLV